MNEYNENVDQDEFERLWSRITDLEKAIDELKRDIRPVKEAAFEWRYFGRMRTDVLFDNGHDPLAVVPSCIFITISSGNAFDGEIQDAQDFVKFKRDNVIIARVPKSLIHFLRERYGNVTVGKGGKECLE